VGTEKSKISADEARLAVATGGATALDVQTEDEWHRTRIPGAKHVAESEFEAGLEGLSSDDRLIVVCEDGERSATVAEQLRDAGWDAASLEGGMKAWQAEDFQVQPSPDPDEDVRI
jgi:rhodanese-related sulfurtransferase